MGSWKYGCEVKRECDRLEGSQYLSDRDDSDTNAHWNNDPFYLHSSSNFQRTLTIKCFICNLFKMDIFILYKKATKDQTGWTCPNSQVHNRAHVLRPHISVLSIILCWLIMKSLHTNFMRRATEFINTGLSNLSMPYHSETKSTFSISLKSWQLRHTQTYMLLILKVLWVVITFPVKSACFTSEISHLLS